MFIIISNTFDESTGVRLSYQLVAKEPGTLPPQIFSGFIEPTTPVSFRRIDLKKYSLILSIDPTRATPPSDYVIVDHGSNNSKYYTKSSANEALGTPTYCKSQVMEGTETYYIDGEWTVKKDNTQWQLTIVDLVQATAASIGLPWDPDDDVTIGVGTPG